MSNEPAEYQTDSWGTVPRSAFRAMCLERDQLAQTNRELAALCEVYAREVAPLRDRIATLQELLRRARWCVEARAVITQHDSEFNVLLREIDAATIHGGSGARPAEAGK